MLTLPRDHNGNKPMSFYVLSFWPVHLYAYVCACVNKEFQSLQSINYTPAWGGEWGDEWIIHLNRGMNRGPDEWAWLVSFSQDPGESPTLFEISALGSLITSVSQDLGFTSPLKDGTFHSPVSPSLHWGIRIYALARGKSAPYWPPTDTTSSSSSVFPVGLPSSTNQAHLLSFRGSAKAGSTLVWLLV